MTLAEKEQEVVEQFAEFDEWLDKYEYLIELGGELEAYPEEKKTEDRLIRGCQSRVWLDTEFRDGRIFFSADSDAIITKGIISLLISIYSGRTPQEILSSDFSVVDKIGLRENLSPTRANGLVSMIETIKAMAEAHIGDIPSPAGNDGLEGQPGNESRQEQDRQEGNEVLTAEDVKELGPLYSDVVLALKQVYDPEIPVNIYDLGLIYELHISKSRDVSIKMTFTAPNCPMADDVINDVKTSVEDVPGVRSCDIELVFEPAWDRSMLSEEARIDLGLDG